MGLRDRTYKLKSIDENPYEDTSSSAPPPPPEEAPVVTTTDNAVTATQDFGNPVLDAYLRPRSDRTVPTGNPREKYSPVEGTPLGGENGARGASDVPPTTDSNDKPGVGASDLSIKDDSKNDGQGGNAFESQAANMWTDLLANYDQSLGGKMEQTYADEARAGRMTEERNAMLGRSISGGGAAAGQAQVALGGMAQRQDVLNKHTQQGLQMKLTYLESLIKRAEAQKDRKLRDKLDAEYNKTLLELQGGQINPTNTAGPEDPDAPLTSNPDNLAPDESPASVSGGDPALEAMLQARRKAAADAKIKESKSFW